MGFRDDSEALRERLAESEHARDLLQRQLDRVRWAAAEREKAATEKTARSDRWLALFLESWKITMWGLAVVGTTMLVAFVSISPPPHRTSVAPPPPTITPLGMTCNNVCEGLGMRQVSHWLHHNDGYTGYSCTCASPGRLCTWQSTAISGSGMSCSTVGGP